MGSSHEVKQMWTVEASVVLSAISNSNASRIQTVRQVYVQMDSARIAGQ